MTEKKNTPFTVTDRRHFTTEGELRPVTPAPSEEQAEREQAAPPKAEVPPPAPAAPTPPEQMPAGEHKDVPPPPSAAEQKAQKDAFDASAKEMDARLQQELNIRGRSLQEFEVSFERFIASLYMTALMQLGLMQEQGGTPHVDLIGGRQSIDTLAMIADKTKGNLTPTEENLLQNCLYELRMAYVEVTNAVNRAAQQPPPGAPGGPRK